MAMRSRLLRTLDLLIRLRRDRRGIYALEFALVANVFLLLLAFCIEAALQLLITVALDHGAREISRVASLGPIGGVETSGVMLTRVLSRGGLSLAALAAEPPILTAELFSNYSTLAAAPALPADGSCPGVPTWGETVGGSGGIVRYCVHLSARSFLPLGSLVPGLYQHRTFFVVRNEPY